MKTKRTPGPWEVKNVFVENSPNHTVISQAGFWGKNIADLGPSELTNEADAKLIAAIPDLLAALQWAAPYLRLLSHAVKDGIIPPAAFAHENVDKIESLVKGVE